MRRDPALRVATLEEVLRYGSRGGHKALRGRGLLPPMMGSAGWTLTANKGTAAVANSLVWGSNVTKGNLLVIGVENNTTQTGTIVNIGDTVNSGYKSVVFGGATTGKTIAIVYGIAGASGANTTSITWNSGTAGSICYGEFSGASPAVLQDGLGSVTQTAATITLPTVTTNLAGDLILNLVQSSNALTVVSPWLTVAAVAFALTLAYQANVAKGTFAPDMTQTSAIAISISLGLAGSTGLQPFPVFLPTPTIGRGVRNRGNMASFLQRGQIIPPIPPQVLAGSLADTSLSSDVLTRSTQLFSRSLGTINLALDPSFEEDTVGGVPPSTIWVAGVSSVMTSNTFLVSSFWAAAGTKSLHVQGTHDGSTTSGDIGPETPANHPLPALAGVTYTFQSTFNVIQAGSQGLQIKLLWLDDTGAQISSSASSFQDAGLTGVFTVNLTATAPAGTVSMRLFPAIYSNTAAQVVEYYVDTILVAAVPAPIPYFDGDLGGSWLGTPGQSDSVQSNLSLSVDVLSRVLALPRSTVDTSASSDALTPVTQFARALADTSASSDVLTPSLVSGGFTRSTADTSLSSDALTRVLGLPRSTADTSATSDALSRVLALPRATADTSHSSDALTRVETLPRALSDTSATSDALSRVLTHPRATADTSVSTDALTRILALPRAVADTSLSSDALTRSAQSFARALADASHSTDALTPVTHFARATADTSLSSDSLTGNKGTARSLADTSVSTDALTRLLLLFRPLADTSVSTDVLTPVAQRARAMADTSLSSDALSAIKGVNRPLADTSLSSDAITRVLLLPRTLADTSVSTDALTPVTHFARAIADTSLSSDSLTGTKGTSRAVADTSHSTDALARVLLLPRPLADTSASSDALTPSTRFARSTTDTSHSTDALTRGLTFLRSTADTSLSSDATTRGHLAYIRSSADTSLSIDSLGTGAHLPPVLLPTTAIAFGLIYSTQSIRPTAALTIQWALATAAALRARATTIASAYGVTSSSAGIRSVRTTTTAVGMRSVRPNTTAVGQGGTQQAVSLA